MPDMTIVTWHCHVTAQHIKLCASHYLLSCLHATLSCDSCNPIDNLMPFAHACRGDLPGEVWFAQLLLVFTYRTRWGNEPELAFVRWFTPIERPVHARNFRLQPFKWDMVTLSGVRGKVFRTDTVRLASVIGPAFMQPDPVKSNIFYFNHWISNIYIYMCMYVYM